MKFTITVAGAELATILAALRFYQQSGQADPANRSDAIHDLATDYERIVSLDSDAIGSLIERLAPGAHRLIANHLAERRRIGIGSGLRPNDYNVRIPDLTVACGPAVPNDPEDGRLLQAPLLVIELLSPSNEADIWANVALYMTMPSVREILLLRSDSFYADLLRRQEDGTWPDNPLALTSGDDVRLESIDFSAPLAAFYRTA